MSEWQSTTLGDAISGTSGSIKTGPFGTTLKASEYSSSGVPIISVGEVGYGSLQLRKDTPMAPGEVTIRLAEYLLKAGDIVLGRKGAVDRSAWVKPEEDGWFLGSDGIRLRLPSTIDSRFVSYQLRSELVKTWLLQHAAGSTMLSLNQKILERVPLQIPELSEQRAIAEVLGALDDKIAANTKLAATADDFIRTDLLRITENVALNTTVGALALNRKELVNPSTMDPETRYVGLEHIPRRSLWIDSFGSASSVTSTKAGFHAGDILFGKLRPYFHKVVSTPFPGVCSTDVLVLAPQDPDLAGFLLASVASDYVVERVTAASEGTRMPRTSWKDLSAVEIAWPGEQKAREFSASIAHVRQAIEVLLQENQTLAATRDALLPQLMSGKLRVRDVEKAVATAE